MTSYSKTAGNSSLGDMERFRASALRVCYARKRLYMPTTQIHAEREEMLFGNISEEQKDAEADFEVFTNGLQSFGTTMFDSGEVYEGLRDYYCRCEISQRRGWAFDQPPPAGYDFFARDFHREICDRREKCA